MRGLAEPDLLGPSPLDDLIGAALGVEPAKPPKPQVDPGKLLVEQLGKTMATLTVDPRRIFMQLATQESSGEHVLQQPQLARVLRSFQPDLTDDQCLEVWNFADEDGSGDLELSEFMQLFKLGDAHKRDIEAQRREAKRLLLENVRLSRQVDRRWHRARQGEQDAVSSLGYCGYPGEPASLLALRQQLARRSDLDERDPRCRAERARREAAAQAAELRRVFAR